MFARQMITIFFCSILESIDSLNSIDVIEELKFKSFPNTFETSVGFCPNRPITNGKRHSGDTALTNDIPFGYNKNLDFKYASKELSILTTLKLPITSDDIYLLRFSFGKHWIGLRVGSILQIEFFTNNKVTTFKYGKINILDDTWHRIAVGIKGSELSLFVDCVQVKKPVKLPRNINIRLRHDLAVEFGQRADDSGPGFVVCFYSSLFILITKSIIMKINHFHTVDKISRHE